MGTRNGSPLPTDLPPGSRRLRSQKPGKRNPAKETQQKKRGPTAAASLQKLTCYSDNVQGSLLLLLCRGTRSPERTPRCVVKVAFLSGKQHQLCAFTRPGIQHLWRGPLTYDAFLLQLCKPNKKIRIDLFLNFPLNSDVVNNNWFYLDERTFINLTTIDIKK